MGYCNFEEDGCGYESSIRKQKNLQHSYYWNRWIGETPSAAAAKGQKTGPKLGKLTLPIMQHTKL